MIKVCTGQFLFGDNITGPVIASKLTSLHSVVVAVAKAEDNVQPPAEVEVEELSLSGIRLIVYKVEAYRFKV